MERRTFLQMLAGVLAAPLTALLPKAAKARPVQTIDFYVSDFGAIPMIGNRKEDLSQVIAVLSPTDTPFMSMVRKKSQNARFHDWIMDELEPL